MSDKHSELVERLRNTLFDETNTPDERIGAAHHLIEAGTRDEVVETFMKQLGAAKPEDEQVNKFIIGIMYVGYHEWMRSKANKVKQTRLFWVKDGKLYPTVEVEIDDEKPGE